MAYKFRLKLTKVEVVLNQLHEPGKDELRLMGFGISRSGVPFSTGFRNLGSYGKDDVRTGDPLPMTLFEGNLDDDNLDVAAFFWVIEEDSGGVKGKAESIEADYREAYMEQAVSLYDFGFPRTCVPFAAFYRALVPFTSKLKSAAHVRFRNDDDVGEPREFFFKFEGVNITGHSGEVLRNFFVPGYAIYNLYFEYSYKRVASADL